MLPTIFERRLARRLAIRAKALIKRGWTRQRLAADACGREVKPAERQACRWCIEGAVSRAFTNVWREQLSAKRRLSLAVAKLLLREMLIRSLPRGFGRRLHAWNDRRGRTKREVIALLDTVILRLSEFAVAA